MHMLAALIICLVADSATMLYGQQVNASFHKQSKSHKGYFRLPARLYDLYHDISQP